MIFLTYILVGMVAGVVAGLFGIGGGLILVPTFIYVFKIQGIAPDILVHMAIATSLVCIVPVSISTTLAHNKKGGVNWQWGIPMAIGMMLGAFLGAKTAISIKGEILELCIGIFAILVAIKIYFGFKPKESVNVKPNKLVLTTSGVGIAWISAIFGIGGGTINVPFLTWRGLPIIQAVGTSAFLGFPIAFFGAISNMYLGWGHANLPEWSVGYVYLPAMLGIVLTSVVFSKLGVVIAHYLSQTILNKVFAGFLILVGISFII